MSPDQIKTRLEQTYGLAASKIEVIDLTGTQDHYQVYIESEKFRGQSRMQQHRAVMDIFDPELKTGEVHALAIVVRTHRPGLAGHASSLVMTAYSA